MGRPTVVGDVILNGEITWRPSGGRERPDVLAELFERIEALEARLAALER